MTKQLVLLGGAAGAGKSTTARALADQLNAGWLQLDTIWVALQGVFPQDSPEYQLLRVDERVRSSDDPVEALVEHHIATSRFVCQALPRALAFELQSHEALVADGSWLVPEFLAGLALDGARITALVLHEPNIDEVRIAMESRRTRKMTAAWHERGVQVSWRYGNWLASEGLRHGIPVVAARPRDSLLHRVRRVVGTSSSAPV